MKKRFGGIVLDTAFRVIVPFTLIYGVYVLIHGEFSPGGGFQAGALMAVGVVLARLIQGSEARFNITGQQAVIFAAMGTFLYAATGLLSMFCGGQFLDYGALPFPASSVGALHGVGILLIEIGVTVCVMMTIIDILDAVVERADIDD